MNLNAGESKSMTNNDRELTDAELQAVAGGAFGLGGLALQRAVEAEEQRLALYDDRI